MGDDGIYHITEWTKLYLKADVKYEGDSQTVTNWNVGNYSKYSTEETATMRNPRKNPNDSDHDVVKLGNIKTYAEVWFG